MLFIAISASCIKDIHNDLYRYYFIFHEIFSLSIIEDIASVDSRSEAHSGGNLEIIAIELNLLSELRGATPQQQGRGPFLP